MWQIRRVALEECQANSISHSFVWPVQKYPEMLSCVSYYQNIAKLLTQPIIRTFLDYGGFDNPGGWNNVYERCTLEVCSFEICEDD